MKYRIKLLLTAQEDLKSIEDWYLMNFDANTALKVTDRILDAIQRLGDFPDSGSIPRDEWGRRQGFRFVIIERHIAIYRVIDGIVFIYHIADTRTEYNRLFYEQ